MTSHRKTKVNAKLLERIPNPRKGFWGRRIIAKSIDATNVNKPRELVLHATKGYRSYNYGFFQ